MRIETNEKNEKNKCFLDFILKCGPFSINHSLRLPMVVRGDRNQKSFHKNCTFNRTKNTTSRDQMKETWNRFNFSPRVTSVSYLFSSCEKIAVHAFRHSIPFFRHCDSFFSLFIFNVKLFVFAHNIILLKCLML